jgi:hypothetical protein
MFTCWCKGQTSKKYVQLKPFIHEQGIVPLDKKIHTISDAGLTVCLDWRSISVYLLRTVPRRHKDDHFLHFSSNKFRP